MSEHLFYVIDIDIYKIIYNLLFFIYSHFFGKNPRLQAGKTSVLAHVKMPACSNIGPP